MIEFAYNIDEVTLQSSLSHSKARFLIDECLGVEVAYILKSLKYKSTFVGEVNLSGKADNVVFNYAWKHKLILLTHDMDFWDARQFPLSSTKCILIFPGRNGEEDILIKAISTALWLVGKLSDLYEHTKISFEANNDFILKRWNKADGYISVTKYRLKDGKIFYEELSKNK